MRKSINLYLVFGAGYLLFLFALFVRIAAKSQVGFSPQAVVVFAAIFLPPVVFSYLAGFQNGRKAVKRINIQGLSLGEKEETK